MYVETNYLGYSLAGGFISHQHIFARSWNTGGYIASCYAAFERSNMIVSFQQNGINYKFELPVSMRSKEIEVKADKSLWKGSNDKKILKSLRKREKHE